MKTRRNLAILVMVTAILFMLGGCGSGGSGSKEPEPFELGQYTYKLDKVKKTDEGYQLSILIKGDSAPVIITNGATRSGIEAELKAGDKSYSYNQVGFSVLDKDEKVGDFGAKAEFSFSVPQGADTPDKAVITDGNDPSQSVELDLSGIVTEK